MKSNEIRDRFLNFFKKRNHAIIPSASLVPENDPSVLFNTAGMQPLVPYLLGQKHPMGKRLANIQKCVRTGDLEDVGDNRHLSFFEMMGNWSLGDYFKKEAINWSYEFLTSKEEGLGLDHNRLYITIFEGDQNAPIDQESKEIWMSLGIPEHRIYQLPAEDNWWSPGDNGPCGPCTEMFYDMVGNIGDLDVKNFLRAVKKEDLIEIWNDVFMEYQKKDGNVIGKLSQSNVDTGAGLERITAVMQGKKTAYQTDLFQEAMEIIKESSLKFNEVSARIIADHVRTAIFLIADGVLPAKKNQGYVLRRLIRRAVFRMQQIESHKSLSIKLIKQYIDQYSGIHSNLKNDEIKKIFNEEEEKFLSTLKQGLKEFEKGIDPFILATTYGFPIELTQELAQERGQDIDLEDFRKKMEDHQKLSQTAGAGMFKGGLGGTSEKIIRSHTAHHLLLSALRAVLGEHVHQRGSNITEERLRIDFSHSQKLTDSEKEKVEKLVNFWISQSLPVSHLELPKEEADKIGAEREFGIKYPDLVSVYFIGLDLSSAISKEFCGGPHISNTKEIGIFKIQKEEASSQGVRRIKAVIE